MDKFKSKYIIYLTTDGAGTHLLRSQIAKNNNKNLKVKVIHESFWKLSVNILNLPNQKNLNEFIKFCSTENIYKEVSVSNINKELIFSCFEEIYLRNDITLDFSKKFTISDKKNFWTKRDVHSVQDLLVEYLERKDSKVQVRFLAQLRNPLDHIASLNERFGKNISLKEIKNQLIENYENIELMKKKFETKNLLSNFISIKFEDFILSKNFIVEKISQFLDLNIDNEFYINKISINKWYISPNVYKFLEDKEIIKYADLYDYKFVKLPKLFWILFFLYGIFLRNYYELILLRDTILNKVDKFNPINTKHQSKGLFVKIIRNIIKLIRLDYQKKHSDNYLSKLKDDEKK